MDAEGVKSLLWILVWGGLFFVMMRYGCGAHIMGGHGGHGGHGGKGGGGAPKDPVCGMAVDPEQAAGAAVHEGKTYYFCSGSCRDKFEQAPRQFLSLPAAPERHDRGHHHE